MGGRKGGREGGRKGYSARDEDADNVVFRHLSKAKICQKFALKQNVYISYFFLFL